MRLLLFGVLLAICLFSFGQRKKDERKLTFLLDKEVTSLSLDCEYENCRAFLYNVHHFKNLESLKLVNLKNSFSLENLQYLISLEAIDLINPKGFDLKKQVKYLESISNLRHLSIVIKDRNIWDSYKYKKRSVKYKRKVARVANKRAKKKSGLDNLPALTYLELRGFALGEKYFLDEVNGLRNLDTFIAIDIGVNLAWCRDLALDTLSYLEVNPNPNILNRQYPKNLRLGTLKVVSPDELNKSGRTEKQLRDSKYQNYGLFETDYMYPTNSYFDYPLVNEYYEHAYSWYYKIPNHLEIDTIKTNDTLTKATYFGSLKTGDDSTKLKVLSPAYLEYPEFMKGRRFNHWDTTSYSNRRGNLNYANGDLIPYQWDLENSPKYYSNRKMKRYVKDYQAYLTIEPIRKVKDKEIFKIKSLKREKLIEQGVFKFRRNENFNNLSFFSNKSFSFNNLSPEEQKRIASKSILDAWFSVDSIYETFTLHVKTITEIQDYDITLWQKNGDSLNLKWDRVFDRYERLAGKINRRSDAKSIRWKRSYMGRVAPNFRYFSKTLFHKKSQEYKMSEKEWKSYYNEVMDNELATLLNTNVSVSLLPRVLELEGIQELSLYSWRKQYKGIDLIYKAFDYSQTDSLWSQPNEIIVFDRNLKTCTKFKANYRWKDDDYSSYNEFRNPYKSSKLILEQYFYVPHTNLEDVTILVLFDNGSFAIVEDGRRTLDATISAEVMPPGLVNFRTLVQFLN
ncbi:MAG: hypothetical protein COA58_02285 [Bacteroidetes bacterium]|nr:MAG: hypothetical protein COA58_02285 [Bacteroidota bacterium]